MKKLISTTGFLLSIITCVFAQSIKATKADTVYYVLNIGATPINDRIITADTSKTHVFYKINCPCLKNDLPPVFLSNVNKKIKISADDFKVLKPIKLIDFIQLVKENDNEKEFQRKFVVYFLERQSDSYFKNRAFFLGSEVTTIE